MWGCYPKETNPIHTKFFSMEKKSYTRKTSINVSRLKLIVRVVCLSMRLYVTSGYVKCACYVMSCQFTDHNTPKSVWANKDHHFVSLKQIAPLNSGFGSKAHTHTQKRQQHTENRIGCDETMPSWIIEFTVATVLAFSFVFRG